VVPIEFVWLIILLLFGLIGVVRGFLRELGVTMVMVILLFAATFFESKITPALTKVAAQLAPDDAATVQAAFWVAAIVVTAFVSYHGETLSFKGSPIGGVLGVFVNLSVGLVNGYLIVGSIWFYLDRLRYPLLNISEQSLSPLARSLIPMLPPKLLAPYFIYIALFLVLMRVIR
jgi:uncharacterized membrane protein required for colicin V production